MAVYCTLHFVIALTVASASATQLVWQSVTGVHIADVDAHIAVQACCRVGPVPELLEVFPPAPTPPEPARVPPVADPVVPPDATPPVPDDLPPLPGMPPRVPPVTVAVEPPDATPAVPNDVPPPPDVPPRAPPVAATVEPPEAIPPVLNGVPPPPEVPPRVVAPPPELPPTPPELLLLLEQANANSIAAGRMRTIEPVLRI